MSASMKYPWDQFKEQIRVFYIDEKNTLDKLLEYLPTLDPTFTPSARMLKMRLSSWGFHKNNCKGTSTTSRRSRNTTQNIPATGSPSSDPTSTSGETVDSPTSTTGTTSGLSSPTFMTFQLPVFALDHAQAISRIPNHLPWAACTPDWNQANLDAIYQDPQARHAAMREAEAALKYLERLTHQQSPRSSLIMPQFEIAALEAGTTLIFSPSRQIWCQYLDFLARDAHEHEYSGMESSARLPIRLTRIQACALQLRSYLQTMYTYGNQLEDIDAEHWHIATFNTIKPLLRSFTAYLNAPEIARILRLIIEEQRYWKISKQHKVEACMQFWIGFWWHDPDWFQQRYTISSKSTTSSDMSRMIRSQSCTFRLSFARNSRLAIVYNQFQAVYGPDFDPEKCIPARSDGGDVDCFMEMTAMLCMTLPWIENWSIDAPLYLR